MRAQHAGSVTLCFDLQQVHYLPKLTLGETFYKRQLSYYTFCVTDYRIKQVHFYSWDETEGNRGAVEISSALIDYLNRQSSNWPADTSKLRLFCDGCAGQNKNQHVMHALSLWLQREAPQNVTKILIYFPVRGHSFLPADRVFGIVENELKKIKEVLLPEEYANVYSKFGTVLRLNQDWNVRNYKLLSQHMKSFTGIKQAKKIVLKRKGIGSSAQIGYKIEISYNLCDKSKNPIDVMKPKRKMSDIIMPPVLTTPIPLKLPKKKDIESLLTTRFGEDWENREDLQFYKDLLILGSDASKESDESGDEDVSESEMCDCLDEEGCIH